MHNSSVNVYVVSASTEDGSHSHSRLPGLAKPIAYIWENAFDSLCHGLPICNSSIIIAMRSSPKKVSESTDITFITIGDCIVLPTKWNILLELCIPFWIKHMTSYMFCNLNCPLRSWHNDIGSSPRPSPPHFHHVKTKHCGRGVVWFETSLPGSLYSVDYLTPKI